MYICGMKILTFIPKNDKERILLKLYRIEYQEDGSYVQIINKRTNKVKSKSITNGYSVIQCVLWENNKAIFVSLREHQIIARAIFPEYELFNHDNAVVDHIDSNKQNNNPINLRLLTQRENVAKERSLKSGLPTGVSVYKPLNKYRATIFNNGKNIHLGYFNTIIEAKNEYLIALNLIKKGYLFSSCKSYKTLKYEVSNS